MSNQSSEVYKYAPYKFQRDFKNYEKSINDGNYPAAKKTFDLLVKEFPEKEYPVMTNLFSEWAMIVDLSFEMEKYPVIEDINKPFWRAFCHKISQKENKNISGARLSQLIEKEEDEYLKEEKKVFEISSKFYRELEKSDFSDQALEDMNYLNQLIIDDYAKE